MIIGIDLGTTNSLACVYRDKKTELIPNNLGEYLTPSVVSLDEDGEIIIGAVARERLVTNPADTVASFKRFMGSKKNLPAGREEFYPAGTFCLYPAPVKAGCRTVSWRRNYRSGHQCTCIF